MNKGKVGSSATLTALRGGALTGGSIFAIFMAATFLVSGFFALNAQATVTSLNLTAPDGNEFWRASQNITWNGVSNNPLDTIDITFAADGVNFNQFIANRPFSDLSFSWDTTSISDTSTARIQIMPSGFPILADQSTNTFTIDNTAPTVPTVLTPNGGQILKGGNIFTVTWTQSTDTNEGPTPIKIEYSVAGNFSDSVTIIAATSDDGSHDWTIPTENTTTAKIRITATDLAGNTSNDVSDAVFTIDSTAPTIPAVSLTGTTIQAGNDTVSIVFSEPVVAVDGTWSSNEFTVIESPNGTPLILTGANFNYVGNTLTITLAEANEYLQNGDFVAVTPAASAVRDPAGNFLATAEVVGTTPITGDVVAPTVALTYNPSRPVKDADMVIITATFSNEALLGIPQIAIATAGDGDVSATGMTATGDPFVWIYSWDVPTGADDDGTATITISGVTDLAGNTNSPATNATRTIDNTAPAASNYTLNGLAQSVAFNPGLVAINVTATEAVEWVSAQIFKNDNSAINKDKFPGGDGTNTTIFDWDGSLSNGGPGPIDGVYNLKVHITDLAGNDVVNLLLLPHTITVDTVNPSITAFTAPVANAVYKANPSLEFTPNDSATAVSCAYAIDGGTPVAVSCTAGVPVNTTITGLSDGRHSVVVTVTDAADNSTPSSAVSFVFDNNNTLTVDDTPLNNPDFSTISEAITKSTANDMISVAAGNYGDSLTIDKALTINGGVGSGISTQTAAVSVTANSVTINNFTFSGNLGSGFHISLDFAVAHSGISITNNIFDGAITTGYVIRVGSNKTDLAITGNTFIGSTGGNGNALIFLGSGGSNISIQGNTFQNIPSTYTPRMIQHNGKYDPASARTVNLNISNNTINLSGHATGMTGIEVRFADYVRINGNILIDSVAPGTATNFHAGIVLASVVSTSGQSTITLNSIDGFSRGISTRRFAVADGFSDDIEITNNIVTDSIAQTNANQTTTGVGLYLTGVTNLLATGNTITGHPNAGVLIPEFVSGSNANVITGMVISDKNNISGSTKGIDNFTLTSVDAHNNWWGTVTGPLQSSTNTAGTGNSVSANVDYSPWCTNVGCTTFGSSDPLDHFNIDPSVGSAIVNVPITLTVTAKDAADITRVNDTSVVSMAADHGASLGTLLLTLANGTNDTTVVNSSTGTVNVSGIKVGGTATGSTSVSFTNSDVASPTIVSHSPLDNTTNVAVSVTPHIVFSESLKASTVNSANIQLKKFSDNSTIPATVSLVEGGMQVNIDPTSPLENNTQYYFAVSIGVQDEVGNPFATALDATTKAIHEFTTVALVPIVVDEIIVQNSTATATDSYLAGWHYIFRITVNTTETNLRVKFTNWVNSANPLQTVAANGNMRLLFNTTTGNGLGSIVGLTDADIVAGVGPIQSFAIGNLYTDQAPGPINITGLDTSTDPGRQIKFDVFTKLPVTTAPGFYETVFGIETL